MLHGGRRLAAAACKEYLRFDGFAYHGIAKADLWGTLLPGEVHVLQNGQAYEGEANLWVFYFPQIAVLLAVAD